MNYILSIDQGTTSSRAILFNNKGEPCFISQKTYECIFPHAGWVEQDAMDILNTVLFSIQEVMSKAHITFREIKGVGITNQRETTIVWDKKSGTPIYNAIVWQSRQSESYCEALKSKEKHIHEKTGLIINPYFSASKIRFILDNVPNGQKRAENGELLFGTVDTWLIYNLTKKKMHVTDYTNASRTLLFNINTLEWDEDLLKIFNIPKCMLPKAIASSSIFGEMSLFKSKVKICGVLGDQQAALFGHGCFDKGDIKNTYGTGCFLLKNIGDKPVLSKDGLLTTIAWTINGKTTYALEGSVFVGGSLINWLRDNLEFFKKSSDSDSFAKKAHDSRTIYVVPAFVGLGAPYWDDDARGCILGINRATDKYDITKASLEAVAYECKDIIEAMKKSTGEDITSLSVDGGASSNKHMMQFQSDICNCKIINHSCLESTALGVSFLAGLTCGFYKNLDAIRANCVPQIIATPKMDRDEAESRYKGWLKAVEAARVFKL